MALKLNETTTAQKVCLQSAAVGLIGSAADVLRKFPEDEAAHVFRLIAQGTASLAWSVEVRHEVADFKLELVHLDGERVLLSVHSLSLVMPPRRTAGYETGLH